MVDSITDVIMREGRTGKIGEGLIWVLPIESARCIEMEAISEIASYVMLMPSRVSNF
ncbi:P-II family nitrogen regulator [Nitrosospira multiformis]|uniref:P-II family nitrogen regulator n=1 Tax=Nitrosospira multiformis TaxID=1231 RepID=UPI000895FB60|nr:P-II family nitrogen regulator [Nitrosospira multiformis]SEA27207.1 nitrogen regulatory protein P-II 1 [Nitrosospira multiformis]